MYVMQTFAHFTAVIALSQPSRFHGWLLCLHVPNVFTGGVGKIIESDCICCSQKLSHQHPFILFGPSLILPSVNWLGSNCRKLVVTDVERGIFISMI